MKFVCTREDLLKPLNVVVSVVERRQTLPILANVLLSLKGKDLQLTGTDLEVELVGRVTLGAAGNDGAITVPARKLTDICKSLPDGASIEISQDEQKLHLKSGRSRFSLTTLPAEDFPAAEKEIEESEFDVGQAQLKRLIEATSFAMAQQDVRYYLNGMLFELTSGSLKLVATDGHRLALCDANDIEGINEEKQIILPGKGVRELSRLLQDPEDTIRLSLGLNHLRAETSEFRLTSKLVDGKFPDYRRVLPVGGAQILHADRATLHQAFSRAAILSNEKFRGVRLSLAKDTLEIVANNPEHEEAEETVSVDYQGDEFEIGFNVNYLLDVLSAISDSTVRITLTDSNSSALIEESESSDSQYVIMPMRL